MSIEAVQTPNVRPAAGRPYSPAIKAGGWLLVAGQVPLDGDGRTVGAGDAEAQWRQCFANVIELVEAAGGTAADVVFLQLFVTDMRHHNQHVELRREYFPEPFPASTVVAVDALAHEDWFLEVQATAYLG